MARKKKVVEINDETVWTTPFPDRTLLVQYVIKSMEERRSTEWEGKRSLQSQITLRLKEMNNDPGVTI